MRGTSTTTPKAPHSAGVLAHGLASVAVHMLEHQLPAPLDICAGREHDHVMVTLASVDLDAWLDTVHIDDVRQLERLTHLHLTYTGATPAGVRIQLRVVHPKSASRTVLAAASVVSA